MMRPGTIIERIGQLCAVEEQARQGQLQPNARPCSSEGAPGAAQVRQLAPFLTASATMV